MTGVATATEAEKSTEALQNRGSYNHRPCDLSFLCNVLFLLSQASDLVIPFEKMDCMPFIHLLIIRYLRDQIPDS